MKLYITGIKITIILMMQEEEFMNGLTNKVLEKCKVIAVNLAFVPKQRTKHFSFLVRKNTIISVGWNNSYKTHPIAKKFGYRFNSIHSELACLINANTIDFSQYKLVNFRLDNELILKNSKPCEICEKLLFHYGISEVFYTTGDNSCVMKKMLIK